MIRTYPYPNLQKITLQCVGGYKQKTPRMWGFIIVLVLCYEFWGDFSKEASFLCLVTL